MVFIELDLPVKDGIQFWDASTTPDPSHHPPRLVKTDAAEVFTGYRPFILFLLPPPPPSPSVCVLPITAAETYGTSYKHLI